MNTKKILTLVATGMVLATSFADEAFDNLVKLSKTPVAEITTENAMQIFDAGVATTNNTTLKNVVSKKFLSFADMYAKIKRNPLFLNTLNALPSTPEERLTVFNDNVDTWCKLSLADREKYYFKAVYPLIIVDSKNKIGVAFSNPEAIVAACEKIAATEGSIKFSCISILVYSYGGAPWENTVASSLPETYKAQLVNFVKAGADEHYWKSYTFLDFVYFLSYKCAVKDYDLISDCLLASINSPVWNRFSKTGNIFGHTGSLDHLIRSSTMKTVRKHFLDNVAETDVALLKVAATQDKIDKNKETTKSIYAKLVEPTNKIEATLYLNDNDKLVDALTTVDNSLSAKTLEKVIIVLNTVDPDWRSADVLKALRVINKKYTLKLYDDRDTWEPILSKVRALIDTYNN